VYLALLAHELRNLLAPIRYAIAALEKPDRTSAHETYALGVMKRQSAQMGRLLDDLLDVSRFAHGEVELRKSSADLQVILGTAIEAARPLLDAKQHTLAVQLPQQTLRLWGDATRLIQVFSNLLINAAKYTPMGGRIELRAAHEGQQAVVWVRDSGIGIAKETLPRLFTLFGQEKRAREYSEGGLGIGLALVHGILDLHGGSIQASSAGPGCGSEFVVRIPVGAAPPEPPAESEPRGSTQGIGLKILVVDDNRDVADSCCMLIELCGHQVRSAYTGVEALALAESFRPHMILTDIGLPDIDGYEFARKIRACDWAGSVVLVAITGWGEEEHRRQSQAAGFNHHLTKPIDPKTMESLLESLTAALRGVSPDR
jgi:CheY-like chemotaxis protein